MCKIEPVDTIEHNNCTIKIYRDDIHDDPLKDWDGWLGTMLCGHKRYELGHEQVGGQGETIRHILTNEQIESVLNREELADWETCGMQVLVDYYPEALDKLWNLAYQKVIILPLYLYDHSGISISTSRGYPYNCPWDSGQLGYIYVTKENVRREYGWERVSKKREELIAEYLRREVETYNQYLTGDVYGFVSEDENGDMIGSCWGFYGHDWEENGLLDHAKPEIDSYMVEAYVSCVTEVSV